jgi:hypothetical protein
MEKKEKRTRYLQRLKEDWFKLAEIEGVYQKYDEHRVKCIVCSTFGVQPVLIDVKSRGKLALIDHVKAEKHIAAQKKKETLKDNTKQTNLDAFFGFSQKVNAIFTLLLH